MTENVTLSHEFVPRADVGAGTDQSRNMHCLPPPANTLVLTYIARRGQNQFIFIPRQISRQLKARWMTEGPPDPAASPYLQNKHSVRLVGVGAGVVWSIKQSHSPC